MKFNCPSDARYQPVMHNKHEYGAFLIGSKMIAWRRDGKYLWVHTDFRGLTNN